MRDREFAVLHGQLFALGEAHMQHVHRDAAPGHLADVQLPRFVGAEPAVSGRGDLAHAVAFERPLIQVTDRGSI